MEGSLRSLSADVEVMTHLAQLMLDQLTVMQATIDEELEHEVLVNQMGNSPHP